MQERGTRETSLLPQHAAAGCCLRREGFIDGVGGLGLDHVARDGSVLV